MMTAEMTSAERLECCLRGQMVDRVPIWMLYNPIYKPNPWYPNYFEAPSYAPVVRSIMENTDCLERIWFSPGIFFSDPASARKTSRIWRDQGYRLHETTLETPAGPLTSYLRHSAEEKIEKKDLIAEIDDLEKILSIPYQPYWPDLTDFFDVKVQLGSRGLMMVNLCDALSQVYFHSDPENFLIWTSLERQKLVTFLDVIHARLMEHLKYLLENGAGPVFFLVGSEFACPPTVSPRTFRDLYLQYNQPVVDLIHSYNGLVLMHHHGAAVRILNDILTLKPDGIQPPEAPPVGNTPLETAKQVIGSQVTLVGNLQYDTLCTASPEQLEAEVSAIFAAWKPGGRFIFAPSAGPYQEALSPTAVRNHLRLVELALELGKY
jgi:uroporphyrinogen-III decarboxylase